MRSELLENLNVLVPVKYDSKILFVFFKIARYKTAELIRTLFKIANLMCTIFMGKGGQLPPPLDPNIE